MAINTTQEEMPTGDGNPTAGNTINVPDSPTSERNDKAFSKLKEAISLKGHALQRTNPADGPVSYWAVSFGLVSMFATLDEILAFLNVLEDLS